MEGVRLWRVEGKEKGAWKRRKRGRERIGHLKSWRGKGRRLKEEREAD